MDHDSTTSSVEATRPGEPDNTIDLDPGTIVGYAAERGSGLPLTLGPDARVRSGTVIYTGSSIGRGLRTGHNVVIREDCVLGDDVSVWSNTIIDYGCRIGDRVKIHSNCYIAQYTVLEDDVFIAPGLSVANDLYPGDPDSAAAMAGPILEAGVQIGVGVSILPYVRIGAGTIVGAGSVVTKDLPPGMVCYGSPAVPHRPVTALEPIADRLRAHPLR